MNIFSPDFIAILTTGSAVVVSITEVLKRIFKVTGFFGYVLSALVSIGVGLVTGIGQFTGFPLIMYVVGVFIVANGFYKVIRSAPVNG